MKIKGSKPNASSLKSKETSGSKSARGAERAGKSGGVGASASAAGSVHLSSAVEEVREIARLARAIPDVRVDVVEQARADLAAGRMHVDSRVLAECMVGEFFSF
jgi:flagellar biosynthesis anti-sigma factor FlgM